MNTPLSWIKAYVPDLDVSEQEYTDAMTMSGSKVEGFEKLDADLDKIVTAKILKIDRHPDADKLIVCQVQISESGDTVQIVTGASNVHEGDLIPVVLDGGRVAGGHDGSKTSGGIKIKKGKLRGVESCGMMCSIEELGSTKDMYPDAPEDGIYILSNSPCYKDAPIGADAIELLGLRDTVFEYEITSNRVDCFSVLGLAREAAATFNKAYIPPVVEVKDNEEKTSSYISVEIKDNDLCSRFVARVVKNIKVGPSPEWMQRRLAACGIRPINNIVDITNYVMEEFGQPMHAYNLDDIAGNTIIVRRGNDGEKFQTLDGQMRSIDSTMLMINDGEKAIGIAGIMGGENTKITENVNTLLLEAACFDGTNVRLTGKKLGLRTDAAAKFEKGLDPNTAMEAINRACQLIVELGVGEIVGEPVDVYETVRQPKRVKFCSDTINQHLGTNIEESVMLDYYKRIGFEYDAEAKEVIIPSWRQDIDRLADLSEETARFFGYDKIPTTLPTGEATTGGLSFKLRVENLARTVAEQFGFCEAMNYSFESPKVYSKLLIPEGDKLRENVVISNPLGEDFSVMRTITLNGMLNSLSTNYNRRNKDVRLYELGTVYYPKAVPVTEIPEERKQLTLGMYGEGDFFTMKGIVEELFERAGLKSTIEYNPASARPYLHPGRQADIIYDDTRVGYIGEIHPDVLDQYDIGTKVYIAVIDMPELTKRASFDIKYQGIAKYPAVTRDISIVMKREVLAGEVEAIIRKYGGKLLESYHLFDLYEGAQIKEGFKSMAYSICFRAKDRTLEEKDVNEVMAKILDNLQKLGIELRQ